MVGRSQEARQSVVSSRTIPGQFAGHNESEGVGDEEGRAEEDLGEEGPEGPHLRDW